MRNESEPPAENGSGSVGPGHEKAADSGQETPAGPALGRVAFTSHAFGPTWGRRLSFVLLITLLIGLPIRLIVVDRAAMVSRDTVTFVWYAQALAEDPLAAMRQHDQHPLYPASVLAAHGVVQRLGILPETLRSDPVRSWTTAAIAVTLLGGLAVIVAVYLLAAGLFDPQTGLVAALLAAAAAEFCQLSGDGLTDMPHLAVYLLAIWAGLRGFQSGHAGWFLGVGALAGIAYLIRPEGAEPAVVTAALLVVPYVCRLGWRQRLLGLMCVLVGSALVASPYMIATGKLVRKKPVWRFIGKEATASRAVVPLAACPPVKTLAGKLPVAPVPAGLAGEVPRALLLIGENWMRSLRGTYLLPLLAWLIWRKRYPPDPVGSRMVQLAVGLHVAILMALIVQFNYQDLFSLRHVMVLTGLTLPFAAAGVIAFIESLSERSQGWAAVLVGLGLIAPTLPWMFEIRHRDDAHFRSAAAWMRENSDGRPRILTERHRMAFYANGDYIPGLFTADAAQYLARARKHRPDWLAFDERRITKESPGFFNELEASVTEGEKLYVQRIESNYLSQGTRRVLIYHYIPSAKE